MRRFAMEVVGSMTLLAFVFVANSSSLPVRTASAGSLMFVTIRGETEIDAGRSQLGVMTANGTNPRVVRDLGRSVDYAVLSPNRRLAGVLGEDGRLSVVDIQRGGRRQVATGANSWTWAPDSRRIAFSSAFKEGTVAQIWIVGADGSNRRLLTHNTRRSSKLYDPYNELAWSPNGKEVAFLNWQHYDWHHPPSGGRLYTIPAAGGSEVPGPRLGMVPATVSWSPDATAIAVASFRDAGVQIVRGRDVGRLRGSACCVAPGFLSWSPDGSRVAFLGADTSTADSGGVARINGSTSTVIGSSSEDLFTRDPTWSPSGDHLAFLQCSGDWSYDTQGRCALYQSDRDGRNVAPVRTTAKVDRLRAWTR